MAKGDDIIAEVRVVAQQVRDFKEAYAGDTKDIKDRLDKLNGTVQENRTKVVKHDVKIKEHDDKLDDVEKRFGTMPWQKKWFWVIIAIIILGLAGVNITDLIQLLGR